MNHPTPEQWMAYLYDEASETSKVDLDKHLTVCPQCREQVDGWRQTQLWLGENEVPAERVRIYSMFSSLKWAAAALFALGLGLGLGYWGGATVFGAPSQEQWAESLRQSLVPQIRAELRREMERDMALARAQWTNEWTALLADQIAAGARQTLEASFEQTERLLAVYESKRQEHDRLKLATLKTYFDARLSKQATDLETVALLTEAGLRTAQHQISQLVDYRPVKMSDEP